MLAKVELHTHLEGTAPPQLIKRLAERNQIDIADDIFADENTFAWKDFLDFLSCYDKASAAIKLPQDYYDVTYEYLAACAKQGAIYVEMMYSPEHAERASGIPSHEHLTAIQQAIDNAKQDFAIEGRIIITCVRHFGVESTIKVAQDATKEPFNCIVGFGMGGDEAGYPPGQFAKAYQIAHAAGLACTVHAGEMDGPERILEAINELPVKRLGHGVRVIESPELIDIVINKDIHLEVCPTSNIVLNVYPDYQHHPLPELLKLGVKCSINSDDPPYFGTTIGHEYDIAQTKLGLSEQQLMQINQNAIEAAFVDQTTKQQLLKKLET